MGPAKHRYRATAPEVIAQGIGELGRLGKGAHEDQIEVWWKLFQQVLHPGVTHHPDVVSLLLTPDTEHLRHDARQVGVHHSAVQRWIGAFRYEIENADAKSAH
jgi:hypothetical protein